MIKILILGGTSEASALASAVAKRELPAIFSYAGRVATPKPQPLPSRIGGFGGVSGLAAFVAQERITHIVDATHPFAAQMSSNVLAAAAQCGVKAVALTRPAWQPVEGDQWQSVASIDEAVSTLAGPPQRVLLAIGRIHLAAFAAQPQHHYVLRLVDRPTSPPPLPDVSTVIDRGPFTLEGDLALLETQRIQRIVCKNSGGEGAASKLTAARTLGLPIVMIERPALPPRHEVHRIDDVISWLDRPS
ncbi:MULTISPECIES: cobalt-precorrin-6A reductase [Halomonadaceae]|jgi:precorrin-6A/cobalt-precorrin-6A reductase|uniref:cobalt-precorrin-6A reductase n=1 Tax=Halomonadaceae TaxID=28256 RepID=UPI0012F1A5BF|nr:MULTISPECIES: cobalt-precorrin-6A reductase [Halomonas]CAD5254168.1 Precorrin-6A reductase [Halomonas sp. I3]CAD5254688.1 Precorrin-6A reductase [Halomonas sp. 156]CAD5294470.1 Precorrin-6A reductase [Halomonas sp. 113]CAD5295691.1 Precorrin-6A reductase [Halomonas sp. 59]VXB84132.1 Precorrin-6A reductase [Halomonas titanicae]